MADEILWLSLVHIFMLPPFSTVMGFWDLQLRLNRSNRFRSNAFNDQSKYKQPTQPRIISQNGKGQTQPYHIFPITSFQQLEQVSTNSTPSFSFSFARFSRLEKSVTTMQRRNTWFEIVYPLVYTIVCWTLHALLNVLPWWYIRPWFFTWVQLIVLLLLLQSTAQISIHTHTHTNTAQSIVNHFFFISFGTIWNFTANIQTIHCCIALQTITHCPDFSTMCCCCWAPLFVVAL